MNFQWEETVYVPELGGYKKVLTPQGSAVILVICVVLGIIAVAGSSAVVYFLEHKAEVCPQLAEIVSQALCK